MLAQNSLVWNGLISGNMELRGAMVARLADLRGGGLILEGLSRGRSEYFSGGSAQVIALGRWSLVEAYT